MLLMYKRSGSGALRIAEWAAVTFLLSLFCRLCGIESGVVAQLNLLHNN